MSDLIRRKDVLDVLRNLAFDYMFQCGEYYGEDERQLTIINARKAIDVIEAMPPTEPEQKKGEWSFIGDNMFKCTCCGVLYTTHQLNGLRNYDTDPYAPYYCPGCGADMRGE